MRCALRVHMHMHMHIDACACAHIDAQKKAVLRVDLGKQVVLVTIAVRRPSGTRFTFNYLSKSTLLTYLLTYLLAGTPSGRPAT